MWRIAGTMERIGIFVVLVLLRLRRELDTRLGRWLDTVRPTYSPVIDSGPLQTRIPASIRETLQPDADLYRGLASDVLAHRFDLLGSGPLVVSYEMEPRGFEGHHYEAEQVDTDAGGDWLAEQVTQSNLPHARAVWGLISDGYTPIDWGRDIKSGYRWDALTRWRDIRFGDLPGVDIKVPWELARMHHLPWLACAYAVDSCPSYPQEFQDQVCDFIATNPPRYGVNWVTAMDEAIRAVNWLVAYDLFKGLGAEFSPEFERVFIAGLRDHARHIRRHLEWTPFGRGNHYLADLTGLLFLAAYLPTGRVSKRWLRFTAHRFMHEVELQFNPDGANFEGSTSYHRLSAEMAAYGTALLLGFEGDQREMVSDLLPPPNWYGERLARMAEFTRAVTRPDGLIVQIGDNDSGRLLKLRPVLDVDGCEEGRDHRALLHALDALLGRGSSGIDADLIRAYAGGDLLSIPVPDPLPSAMVCHTIDPLPPAPADGVIHSISIPVPPGALDPVRFQAFPDFGLYVWRSERLHLAVRAGHIGTHGIGAHDHCDQLSLTLWLDGVDLIPDPGTYIYTALPDRRNAYRSVMAHYAPRIEGCEPADLDHNPFILAGAQPARVTYAGSAGLLGTVTACGHPLTRRIEVGPAAIHITDHAPAGAVLVPPTYPWTPPVPFSRGYGEQSL